MPVFVGRSAGLLTQPSTHQLKFRSPVPSNPMIIPAFIQRELAPLTHTHSQGDITGAGAGASAAKRGLFVSLNNTVARSNVDDATCYFEVRDGLSARASEVWLINAWTDSVNPPVQPRGVQLSTVTMHKGDFFFSNASPGRSRDFLFHTTKDGSAMVIYGEDSTATVYLKSELLSPTLSTGEMAFP